MLYLAVLAKVKFMNPPFDSPWPKLYPPTKFHGNPFGKFCNILIAVKQTNHSKNLTSLVEVIGSFQKISSNVIFVLMIYREVFRICLCVTRHFILSGCSFLDYKGTWFSAFLKSKLIKPTAKSSVHINWKTNVLCSLSDHARSILFPVNHEH